MSDETQTVTDLITPAVARFLQETREAVDAESVESLTITTREEYVNAAEAIKYWKHIEKKVKGAYSEAKAPLLEQTRALDAQFGTLKKKLPALIKTFGTAMGEWEDRQKIADAYSAEKAGVELEHRRAELREKIVHAEEKMRYYRGIGRASLASDWEQKALSWQQEIDMMVPVPAAGSAVPKTDGLTTQRRYRGRVVDIMKFAKFCVKNPVFLHLLGVNQKALDAQAKAIGGQQDLPGIEWYVDYAAVRR